MESFTQDTIGYEKYPIYVAIKKFFDSYLIERDFDKTISFIEDNFYGIGTCDKEVAIDKSEYMKLLRTEIDVLPESIGYNIISISGKEISENLWNVLANIETFITKNEDDIEEYLVRFSGIIRLNGDRSSIVSMHISEPSDVEAESKLLSSKQRSQNSLFKNTDNNVIFDIMTKGMPGAIIIGYAEDGYPLCFVNDRYLELLGYSSYEEYYEEANGLGIAHIHPDDMDMVNKETMNSYLTGTQYGLEYRIRHKDGHYIYVYDIGKKLVMPNNEEVIICVLFDMTEDAMLKELLLYESSFDALTGVYNRGGGARTIEHSLNYSDAYTFAFFDIDNLKKLNDVYNHSVGDHALKFFAELLKKYFDKRAVLSRLGGDEFVAFINEKRDRARIDYLFNTVEQEYCKFIEKYYPDSHSSVSIGCVIGERKSSFEDLCNVADELMYEIKKNGKKGYKIVELD